MLALSVEEAGVSIGGCEAVGGESVGKVKPPNSGCLLQAVNGLPQVETLIGVLIRKAGWNLNINVFIKGTIEESSGNVKLLQL
jgi:hypothetical protein